MQSFSYQFTHHKILGFQKLLNKKHHRVHAFYLLQFEFHSMLPKTSLVFHKRKMATKKLFITRDLSTGTSIFFILN